MSENGTSACEFTIYTFENWKANCNLLTGCFETFDIASSFQIEFSKIVENHRQENHWQQQPNVDNTDEDNNSNTIQSDLKIYGIKY